MSYVYGQIVPWHIQPGVLIASYIVSLIGAITTVELLHRHQSGRGWLTWLHRSGIAISFGLVAIWCMHFVGNRAIIMGNGDESFQLFYNSGFTALSAIFPVAFLLFGFSLVELRQPGQRYFWPMLVTSGFCAGLAIVGMHYVGNFGISNYKVNNPPAFICGAAAIAVSACILALSLFFYFRERWINNVMRRLSCACVLACAVSGMHWVATVGTSYRLKPITNTRASDRNTNLIVAIVISLIACSACLTFAYLTQRRKKQLADRAQHVVLVSATFDQDGHILVTQEGLMPTQRITKAYNQRSFSDEFNVAHPVFQWLFRVSCYWQGVTDLIPAMKAHLRVTGGSKDATRSPTPDTMPDKNDEEAEQNYSLLFREQFCVAAAELADLLQVPIADLGILYDGILATGSVDFASLVTGGRPKASATAKVTDLESAIPPPMLFGRGQALFVVRYADEREHDRLVGAGFRFADVEQVGNIIAQTMQVPRQELVKAVDDMHEYYRKEDNLPASGTFLACYCLRPAVKTSTGSWDILVPKDFPFRLPKVELLPGNLKTWQMKLLNRLDGFSVTQCINWLSLRANEPTTPEERDFIELLLNRINALTKVVAEPFFRSAVFTAQAVDAAPNHTTILAFCIIPDVHSASIKASQNLSYVPLSFFRCRQRTYKNSPDHTILARKIHSEFGAIVHQVSLHGNSRKGSVAVESMASGAGKRGFFRMNRSMEKHRHRDSVVNLATSDTASDRELVTPQKEQDFGGSHINPFGGIMVSQDVVVDSRGKDETTIEMQDLESTILGGEATAEQPTFVDELFRITTGRWHRK